MDRAGQEVFLDRFLPLCAEAGSACAFSAGGNLRAKWRTLLARAQAGQLSYQDLMIFAYYDMEDPIADWPGLASYLQGLYTYTAAGQALTIGQSAGLAQAATMPCATWPTMHTDAYDGPWNRSRTPILVINAVHDPITPIWGAEAAVRELGNARLLKVNGEGHTSMFVEPSTCRDDAELGYLVSLQLPPKGTACNVDQLPGA